MIQGRRIVKAERSAGAFDGESARLYGGRWNSLRRPVVYLGGTPAIADLEIIAHNARRSLLTQSFVIIEALLPQGSVADLDPSALPARWNDPADTSLGAAIGNPWLESGAGLALRVPSAVLPLERNIIVNVRHPRFPEMMTGEALPFAFDPRFASGGDWLARRAVAPKRAARWSAVHPWPTCLANRPADPGFTPPDRSCDSFGNTRGAR